MDELNFYSDTNINNNREELIKHISINLKGIIYVRDALSFYLTDVRIRHNQYNIAIIIISLITALFEAIKNEMNWNDNTSELGKFSSLLPIALATFTGFVSSMLKFERLAEKIEDTTKAIEKCHQSSNQHRQIIQVQYTGASVSNETMNSVYNGFRECVLSAEIVWLSRMDPITKNYYLLQSSKLHDGFLIKKYCGNENDETMLSIIKESFMPLSDLSKLNSQYYGLNLFCHRLYYCNILKQRPRKTEHNNNNNSNVSHDDAVNINIEDD